MSKRNCGSLAVMSHASTISGRRTFILRSNTFILLMSFFCFFDICGSSSFLLSLSYLFPFENASLLSSSSAFDGPPPSSLVFFFSTIGVVKYSNTCLNSAMCYKHTLIINIIVAYPSSSYRGLIHPYILNLELRGCLLLSQLAGVVTIY